MFKTRMVKTIFGLNQKAEYVTTSLQKVEFSETELMSLWKNFMGCKVCLHCWLNGRLLFPVQFHFEAKDIKNRSQVQFNENISLADVA